MSPSLALINQGIRKALKTQCQSKIAAIAFDKRGTYLGICINSPRFSRKGGGIHAELLALRTFGKELKTIVLIRTGNSGILRPIECCATCAGVMRKNNIKVITIRGVV